MKFVNLLLGVRRKVLDVKFEDWNGALRTARDFDDQLWLAIKEILLLEVYEMLPHFKSEDLDLVVDAGAHVGLYALKVAGKTRRVIALEPAPANYKLLSENIRKNKLTNRVVPLRVALWKKSDGVTLFEGGDTSGSSIFGTSGKKFKSPSVTLQDILHRYGNIDLLKMDIEGAEHEILLKTRDEDLKKINRIVAELHPPIYGERGITNILLRLKELKLNVVLKHPVWQPYGYIIRKVAKTSLVNLMRLKVTVPFWYAGAKLVRASGCPRPTFPILYAWKANL